MRDLFIVGLAALYIGLGIGVCWREFADPFRRLRARRVARAEEQHARDVEGRLTGRARPKHRARAEPVVIRRARITGSKSWSR